MLGLNKELDNKTMKRLHDGRVPKVIVFDTETAPVYDTVPQYTRTSWDKPKYNVIEGSLEEKVTRRKQKVTIELDTGETEEREEWVEAIRYSWLTDQKQRNAIFDIGYTIADKKNNIFIKRNWLVREIFTDISKMKYAFYYNKYPEYLEMLSDGKVKLENWSKIIAQMEQDIIDYDIQEVYAYNITFDKGAINDTQTYLSKSKFLLFEDYNIKTNCLWGMAAETILSQVGYIRTALENNWVSEKGNIKTSAEMAYRYITGEHEFIESHTALDDSIIETEILARCFATKRRMSFGIVNQPWKLVKGVAEAKGLL